MSDAPPAPPLAVDHLVYAVPDLDAAVATVAARLGVTPTPGGAHPGFGTRNALLALGADVYLEIIGPDPAQPDPPRGRPFGVDAARAPQLTTWAVRTPDMAATVAAARAAGYEPGTPVAMSRRRPDGGTLAWQLAVPGDWLHGTPPDGDGLVPFVIDWLDSPHPAPSAAPGCRLVSLRAEHPQPAHVYHLLAALGADLPVRLGPLPRLVAVIETPFGRIPLT